MSKLWKAFYKARKDIGCSSFLLISGTQESHKAQWGLSYLQNVFFHPRGIPKHFMNCQFVSHLPVMGNMDCRPLCQGLSLLPWERTSWSVHSVHSQRTPLGKWGWISDNVIARHCTGLLLISLILYSAWFRVWAGLTFYCKYMVYMDMQAEVNFQGKTWHHCEVVAHSVQDFLISSYTCVMV